MPTKMRPQDSDEKGQMKTNGEDIM